MASANQRLCAVPGAVSLALNGELPPLSVLSKRVASAHGACTAAAGVTGQPKQTAALDVLASKLLASSQERSDAVHQAFNEWTRPLTPVLASAELHPKGGGSNNTTAAQHKGAPRSSASWWDEQGPQIMQVLLQEPDQQQEPEQQQQQQAAPAGVADAADPMLLLWSGADHSSQPAPQDTSPAAAQTGPAGATASTQQQQQHVSPFAAVPAPDPCPGSAGPLGLPPTGLQLPIALAASDAPVPAAGLRSPFANPGQGPADVQSLRAPELLPAYKLPAHVPGRSSSHTPGCSGSNCSPTCGAAAAQAAAPAGAQYQSPFTSISPWDLAAAAAGGSNGVFVGSLAAAAAAAVHAQAVLAEARDAVLGPQRGALRWKRVRKSLGVRSDVRKMHSSTRVKLEIKELEAQRQALLTMSEAEEALNNIMRQRWMELDAAYDAGLRQHLSRTATPPAGFLAVAAAAAAAAAAATASSTHAAGGSTAAMASAAVALPVSLHDGVRLDALAAAVQASLTDKLAQLADLLPMLDRGCSGSMAACQQPLDTAAAAPAGRQGLPASSSIPANDLLQSPFAAASVAPVGTAAAAATAAGASANPSQLLSQNAEAAALSALSLPAAAFDTSMRLSDLPDGAGNAEGVEEEEVSSLLDSSSVSVRSQRSVSSSTGSRSGFGSGSHGVKRGRGATAAGNLCADLSLLMSSNLSLALQQPCAKHARVGGSCSLNLTESDMRLLFSAWSTEPPAQPAGLLQQQQQEQRQQGQQQLGGSSATASGLGAGSASVAAARLSAGALCGSLWGLFRQVALVGPCLMYRCFVPRAAYCPCCYSSQQYASVPSPRSGLLAMLLEDEEGTAAAAAGRERPGCVCSACGQDAAGAAEVGAPATAAGGEGAGGRQGLLKAPGQAVPASPAHWQRVKDSMCLSLEQEAAMCQLWANLQEAHAFFADRQLQLCQALQQQFWSTGGWPGVASYSTCCAGEAAAAVTEQLLTDMSSSIAADCVIFLESCNLLWGESSLLTLEQKAKCLVASYPFWPDYCLLECLAQAGAAANTAAAAAAGTQA